MTRDTGCSHNGGAPGSERGSSRRQPLQTSETEVEEEAVIRQQ